MRFEVESWRKLYVLESFEHRVMPLFTRGLRDYLLRFAEPDGTLLRSSRDQGRDLALALGVSNAAERRQLTRGIDELVRVGYLTRQGTRLWITKFREAQDARSPGAVRQQRYRDRQRDGTGDVTPDVTNNVTLDETRRDETRTDESAPGGSAWDTDRDTPCPLDLTTRAEAAGILQEFAAKAGVSVGAIRRHSEEFAGYWTIGGGAGKARRNWLGKLRQRLHELNAQGKLVDQDAKPAQSKVPVATEADVARMLGKAAS